MSFAPPAVPGWLPWSSVPTRDALPKCLVRGPGADNICPIRRASQACVARRRMQRARRKWGAVRAQEAVVQT